VTNVLFVCVGNAGRSQVAQAFFERLVEQARSPGTRPSPEVHANVVEAMREVGIDFPAVLRKLSVEDVDLARHHDAMRGRVPGGPRQGV
jgi:protein-tyrosine-phosphatase